ncbi:MAG: Gfo/Idh/MocA family oxidoreductase [Clostridia bacterium]|nr:Gfo/Idh/MocA family oxidoreductase [Clostridia bacterium]MBR3416237.1 Gfo/Idh/MocA family oxidoreductase [Clostridia bacterium]
MSDAVLSQFKQAVEEKTEAVTDKKFKVGIIGTGWIAESHIESYLNQPDVEIVAAADIIPGKAKAKMERYGLTNVRCYESHQALIDNEELDGVSVCTYNRQHKDPTIYALERDIPVLLEKPFTVTLDEAVEICRAEKKSKAFVSVGFQPRFDENMKMIKKIVESGALGDIYYIQTGGGRRRGIPGSTFIEDKTGGIGALGDIGCYSLDMVLNAIGYPKPLTVTGYVSDFFGKNPKYNGEDAKRFSVDDFGAAFVRLEGDIILDFRISWAMHPDTPGDTLILGKEGALRIPSTDCWNGSVGGPMTLYHDICGEQAETVVPLVHTEGGLFDKKIRSFVDAARLGLPAPVPTSQILYNQAIIDGINKSAKLGREIEVEIPEI